MKRWTQRIDDFFFKEISASGFGLARIAWALTVLVRMLEQWPDVVRYYSNAGLLPPTLDHLINRNEWRFTLLSFITAPSGVFLLYVLLLASCLCMLVGQWPRLSTIVTTVLLFSFHERNPMPLGGGDTVLRLIAVPLCLSPGVRAFSLARLRDQWQSWKKNRALLAPLQMSIWPQRLLLWQAIVIYGTSLWDKLYGSTWLSGSAITIALHHLHFTRLSSDALLLLLPLLPAITRLVMVYEGLWLLLLIPSSFLDRFTLTKRGRLRRFILLGGILFHGSIFLLMDVGDFSAAMLVLYLCLLRDEDFEAIRQCCNRRWHGTIAILYDGACGLCRRSVFVFLILDHLHRLRPVNFRIAAERKAAAPDLRLASLDHSMHIRFPDGNTEEGFTAFRALIRNLPFTWILWPFLHLPGVPPIGTRIYGYIAARRDKCAHDQCNL